VSLGRSGPGVRSGLLETRRTPFGGVFLASRADRVPIRSFPTCVGRVRHRSEVVDVDHGQFVGRGLKDVAIVMDLHELAPVGGRVTSGRHRWRLERFAKMREDFPDRPRIGDECDQPDVAAAGGARKRKLLPDPRHQLGPGNP